MFKKTSTGFIKTKILFFIVFSMCFFSCKTKPHTIIVWTDKAEMASYIEHFNNSQEKIRAVLVYKERLALSFPVQKDEKSPDVVIGSFLMNSLTKRTFLPVNSLMDTKNASQKIDFSVFYPSLLQYGQIDNTQYLFPVSFNLPLIMFSEKNEPFIPDSSSLELEEIKEAAGTFNAKNGNGTFSKMGFAPSWNADFVYTAAKITGADFMEIGKSFGWNLTALENTIDFMREWTKEFNTSSESETDFSFKYLYTPPYKQIMSGRCLFAYSRSNEFFALTAEQIADADFRWLSSEGEIFAEDDITSAGIYRKTREKTAAKTFLRWILSEKTQKELLDRTKEHNLSVHKFGICDGFSSIRTVNERYFPVHYKNLLGNLPGENAILAPLPLPPRWESLKSRVLIPYLSDAIKDEPPRKMQTIDDRLKMWSKQFN